MTARALKFAGVDATGRATGLKGIGVKPTEIVGILQTQKATDAELGKALIAISPSEAAAVQTLRETGMSWKPLAAVIVAGGGSVKSVASAGAAKGVPPADLASGLSESGSSTQDIVAALLAAKYKPTDIASGLKAAGSQPPAIASGSRPQASSAPRSPRACASSSSTAASWSRR